jgi:hypothetical protein
LAKYNPKFDKFSQAFIENAIASRFEHSCSTNDDSELITILFDNMDLNEKNLAEMFKCRNNSMNARLAQFIDKYDGTLTKNMMYNSCKSLPYTKDVIKILLAQGLEIDDHAFDIVCEYCDRESIKFIFDETRIKPKRRHFQKLAMSKKYVDNKTYELRKNSYSYRRTGVSRYEDGGYNMNKMELLIGYGYKPDYEDLFFGAKYKAEIPNIGRFDIKLDQALLDRCWDYDFYPKYDFNMVSAKMMELQQICNSRATAKLKNFLKNNSDIVPDRKCMENACRFKNNQPVIDQLIKRGGKFTVKCIENCANEFKCNGMLLNIIGTFKKEYNQDINDYKHRIKELENTIKMYKEGQLQANDCDVVEDPIDVVDSVDPADPVDQVDSENEMMANLKSELLDNIDESDEELITVEPKKKVSKKTGGKKKAKKATKGDDEDKTKKKEVIDFDDDDLDEVLGESEGENECEIKCWDFYGCDLSKPENLRRKDEIPKSYRIHFKKKKGTKMSFLAIKKELIGNITKNGWFLKDNQQYISLPSNLEGRLGLEEDTYISFNDIDKLVRLFYN